MLAAGLLALGWLVLAAPGAAEERLRAGTTELTVAGGVSVSHAIGGTEAGVTGAQLLPHVGLFVGEEATPPWLAWPRGPVELLAEPTVVHYDTRPTGTGVGLSAVARWVVAGGERVRWYVEAGPGVLTGESGPPEARCDALFVLQAGAGVLLFWSERHAVTLGYRAHHVSNGGACAPNHGVNSSVFVLGLTDFFR